MKEENKCSYCGEEEGTQKIADPNLDMSKDIDWNDDKNYWMVCKDCDEVIPLQRMNSFGIHINDEKIVAETNKKLQEIAKRTKKPILNASLRKTKEGYKEESVEFTGES